MEPKLHKISPVLKFLFNASLSNIIVEDLTFHDSKSEFTQPRYNLKSGRSSYRCSWIYHLKAKNPSSLKLNLRAFAIFSLPKYALPFLSSPCFSLVCHSVRPSIIQQQRTTPFPLSQSLLRSTDKWSSHLTCLVCPPVGRPPISLFLGEGWFVRVGTWKCSVLGLSTLRFAS